MNGSAELKVLVLSYISNVIARRWTVLLIAWIVCPLGWLGVASISNSYTSEAKIYVDTQSLLRPLMKDMAIQPDINAQLDIMRRTLFSRANVEEIIRKTDMDLAVGDDPVAMDRLIQKMATSIEMKVDRSNLFTFSYTAKTPELAQKVVDTTLQIFVEMNLGNTQQNMEEAQRFIDQQISEYELKLRRAEIKVAEYKRRHAVQLGNSDRNVRALESVEARQKMLQSELEAAVWQRNQLAVRIATVPKFLPSTEAPQRDPVRAALEQQMLEHRSDLGRLMTLYTDMHPDVVSARNRIAQAEAALAALPAETHARDELINPVWQQLSEELESAELTIASIRTRSAQAIDRLDELARRVADTPAAEAELVHLTRDYEIMVKQYERLIERRESARLGQRLGAEADSVEFRVVEPPLAPVAASGPPRMIFLAVILVLGCAAGVGVAVLRVLLSDAFLGSRQLTKAIGLPVIGVFPVTRSLLGARRKFADAVAAFCIIALLFGTFVSISYYYATHPNPPLPSAMVKNLSRALG